MEEERVSLWAALANGNRAIKSICNVFVHLTGCIQYLKDGRQGLPLYCCPCVDTCREVESLKPRQKCQISSVSNSYLLKKIPVFVHRTMPVDARNKNKMSLDTSGLKSCKYPTVNQIKVLSADGRLGEGQRSAVRDKSTLTAHLLRLFVHNWTFVHHFKQYVTFLTFSLPLSLPKGIWIKGQQHFSHSE